MTDLRRGEVLSGLEVLNLEMTDSEEEASNYPGSGWSSPSGSGSGSGSDSDSTESYASYSSAYSDDSEYETRRLLGGTGSGANGGGGHAGQHRERHRERGRDRDRAASDDDGADDDGQHSLAPKGKKKKKQGSRKRDLDREWVRKRREDEDNNVAPRTTVIPMGVICWYASPFLLVFVPVVLLGLHHASMALKFHDIPCEQNLAMWNGWQAGNCLTFIILVAFPVIPHYICTRRCAEIAWTVGTVLLYIQSLAELFWLSWGTYWIYPLVHKDFTTIKCPKELFWSTYYIIGCIWIALGVFLVWAILILLRRSHDEYVWKYFMGYYDEEPEPMMKEEVREGEKTYSRKRGRRSEQRNDNNNNA